MQKAIKDLGEKVKADDKTKIEAAIASLKEAMNSDNVESIKAKSNELAQASMKLGEALYGQPGAGGDAGGADGGGKQKTDGAAGDNVVDADFEEVKDDKKKSA